MTARSWLLAAAAAALPVSAAAHHGWISYDETQPVTLTGHLTSVEWSNPHATATMVWQGRQWDVILAPVSRMTARGLALQDINNRQTITITGYVRRDGTPEMRLERVRVGDRVVELR
ncbi:hypothetical protein EYB45_06780 [Erythrobacteraceae bacterium CFH 75059]|nr:hypothetical protein EYB45_06780 [Erythrobacteraceae bacterium CFH 75059]